MTLDPRLAVLTAESGLSRIAADPIAAFRFSSKAQRRFAEAFHKFREVYLRSGNAAGKTWVGAHYFVALMRGVKKLDGVDMPMLGTPVSGVALAQGREMAKESIIAAVLRAVGQWPHHVEKNGNAIAAIWVKPDNSRDEDWQRWSVVRFFVEDGQSVEGMRLDFAWADEPPKWDYWTSLRMRGRANRAFLRAITATPLDKRRWKPVREDFKGCTWPHGKAGKVEIQLSVYDNKALSQETLRQREEDAAGPMQKAKLLGEYVDTTGSNPFDAKGLERWSARCKPPIEQVEWFTRSGARLVYDLWEKSRTEEEYLVVADPSGGIEDEAREHDPCEVIVVARRKREVVVRYNGYLRSAELGRLCVHLAKQYNTALVAFERNSGYGEAFFDAAEREGYSNFYIEHHMDSRSMSLSERIGWNTNATSRGTIIAALQRAIEDDTLLVWSADAVDSLGSVVVKRDGIRIEAGAGAHDEDMICLGFANYYLDQYPVYWQPENVNATMFLERAGIVRKQPKDDADERWVDF